jgi:hypothetical protein
MGSTIIAFLGGCSIGGDPLLVACEEVLKDRLRAPATYNRIESRERTEELEDYVWVAWQKAEGSLKEIFEARAAEAVGEGKPLQRITVHIVYDAANAFGTPIRGRADCTYLTVDDDRSGLATTSAGVRVDGLSHIEWLVDQLDRD